MDISSPPMRAPHEILRAAAKANRLDAEGAAIIRDGSNTLYLLRNSIVARVGRPGTVQIAKKEIRVSRWLADNGVPVIHALDDLDQPTIIHNHPVTWWEPLPPHRPATPAELATALRVLHDLPIPPNLELPQHDPFADLERRIEDSHEIPRDHIRWLSSYLDDLSHQYKTLTPTSGGNLCVIHGDAWQGNIAVPTHTANTVPVILDLENVSIGKPEWDLLPIAVDYIDFGRINADEYKSFTDAYNGPDVTHWDGFRTLASLQELRWLCFILTKTNTSHDAATEALHRIACLHGDIPRPWSWRAF